MPLSPGQRLGPYEILTPLGAGGMGEVYRAKDTRLGRDVAIKVLPAHMSSNPEIRARFEREARAVSSLNHPHICSLYDIGHQDGIDFLVLELVEGETLAKKLERGPLPVELLLRTAIEIADALDRAHRSGIVHRDLKPGNVMLTKSGAKLMDFGLARASGLDGKTSDLTSTPTVTRALTAEGTLVGTFQYMSPEQLEGRDADTRSDLWAFGATLHEMATGKKAFEGRSQASLIAAILEREPTPVSQISPLLPPGLDRLVKACLAKDPDQRLQTAHDAKLQLQWISEGGSQAGVPAPLAAKRRSRESLAWIIAGAAALVALVLIGAQAMRKTPSPQVMRFRSEVSESLRSATWPRVSPNGKWIAFLGDDSSGVRHIWLRALDAFEAYPVPGSESPGRPFWSPDSRYLGYFHEGKLMRIGVGGGPAVTIGQAQSAFDGSWGKDFVLFDGSSADSIRMMPVAGGAVRPASRIDRANGETGHAWPFFLPDGKHFLFLGMQRGGESGFIKLGTVGSLESKSLGRTDGRIEYAPPGYLVYTLDGALMAQRFDARALQVRGDPVPIGEKVTIGTTSGEFSVSPSGILVYRISGGSQSRLVWLDRTGKVVDSSCPSGNYMDFALAPDEQHVALMQSENTGPLAEIWGRDLVRGTLSRLTFSGAQCVWPRWSPDGRRLAFGSNMAGSFRVYMMSMDGSGQLDSLHESVNDGPADWSRDGRYLAVDRVSGTTTWDILVFPLEGERKPIKFAASQYQERQARFSPDGQWIAYTSNENGGREVFVQSFPPGRKIQVSPRGGWQPAWRADGRELYYMTMDDWLMAVPVQPGPTLQFGQPTKLFQVRLFSDGFIQSRIVPSADGSRFLANVPDNATGGTGFSIVTNWATDLKDR